MDATVPDAAREGERGRSVFHIPTEQVSSATPIDTVAGLLGEAWIDGPMLRGDSFVGPSPAERRHARAAEALAGLSGERNAVDARVCAVVAAVVAHETWNVNGVRSAAQWVSWQLGIGAPQARRVVAVATARATHPRLTALFDAGKLSLAQIAVGVRVDPRRDGELAELAPLCTVGQLQTITRAMVATDATAPDGDGAPDDDGDESAPAPRDEFFDLFADDDGGLRGAFRLNAEHAKIVDAALRHARDILYHANDTANDTAGGSDNAGDAEPEPAAKPKVTWLEAFVEMAGLSVDADECCTRRDRFRINIFIDPTAEVAATWGDRIALPDWLAAKLTCDGTISPVFANDGHPVSVGRSLRIVPDRTRRLVLWRDAHTCRVPWCTKSHWLDVHHVVHWVDGGRTDTVNLISICSSCHRAVHRGELNIAGNADDPVGLTFTSRHGVDLSPPEPKPPPGPPPGVHRYRHPLGEQLRRRDLYINPLRD